MTAWAATLRRLLPPDPQGHRRIHRRLVRIASDRHAPSNPASGARQGHVPAAGPGSAIRGGLSAQSVAGIYLRLLAPRSIEYQRVRLLRRAVPALLSEL